MTDREFKTSSYPDWVRVIPAQAERLEIIPNTIFLEGAIGRPKMQVGFAGMGKSIHLEIGSGGGSFSVEGLRRYSKVFASLADVMEKINEQ